jgi:hypothetical protein
MAGKEKAALQILLVTFTGLVPANSGLNARSTPIIGLDYAFSSVLDGVGGTGGRPDLATTIPSTRPMTAPIRAPIICPRISFDVE